MLPAKMTVMSRSVRFIVILLAVGGCFNALLSMIQNVDEQAHYSMMRIAVAQPSNFMPFFYCTSVKGHCTNVRWIWCNRRLVQ
jgi:hypothetical protein